MNHLYKIGFLQIYALSQFALQKTENVKIHTQFSSILVHNGT